MAKGILSDIDLNDVASLQEVVHEVMAKPGEIRGMLTFDARIEQFNVIGDRLRPQEVGEFGSVNANDYQKDTVNRIASAKIRRFEIPLGISERAVALSKDKSMKIGSLDFQVKRAMNAMKRHEESRILYDILTCTDLNSFTNSTGGTSDHMVAVATANVVTMEEIDGWRATMRTSRGNPVGILAGVTASKWFSQEVAMSLPFATPQSGGWLENGIISGVLGLKFQTSILMPDNYFIMYGMATDNDKPSAFYDLIPAYVKTVDNASGLVGAKICHEFAVTPVSLEGLLVGYTAATTWSTPSASTMPFGA